MAGRELNSISKERGEARALESDVRRHITPDARAARKKGTRAKHIKESKQLDVDSTKERQHAADRITESGHEKETSQMPLPFFQQSSSPLPAQTCTTLNTLNFDISILRKIGAFSNDTNITAYRTQIRNQLCGPFEELPAQLAALFPLDPHTTAFEEVFEKSRCTIHELNLIFASVCIVTILQWVHQLPPALQGHTDHTELTLPQRLFEVAQDYGRLNIFKAIEFQSKCSWYTVVYGHYMLGLVYPEVSHHLNLAVVMELMAVENKSAEQMALETLLRREDLQGAKLPAGTKSLVSFMASVTLEATEIWLKNLLTVEARTLFEIIGEKMALKFQAQY